jgi:hypothetical protein
MPKGRIINSCTVDYQTAYIHIIGTVVSLVKLTLPDSETLSLVPVW